MSEGVQKLIEYLNQTRRQAEQAVDCLNERIKELEEALQISNLKAEKNGEERDYMQRYAEQLKIENSKKWRLQERDDWKALVDSVQKDRDRLHDECLRLETELENANHYIRQQENALAKANMQLEENMSTIENSQLPAPPSPTSPIYEHDNLSYTNTPIPSHRSYHTDTSPKTPYDLNVQYPNNDIICSNSIFSTTPLSPFLRPRTLTSDNTNVTSVLTPTISPSTTVEILCLKNELEKLRSQYDVECKSLLAINLAQEVEINQLRKELESYRAAYGTTSTTNFPPCSNTSNKTTSLSLYSNAVDKSLSQPNPHISMYENENRNHYLTIRHPPTTSKTSWGNIFNVFNIFFSHASSSGHVTQV